MAKITFVLTGIVVALGLTTLNPGLASASPFTPLEWQQEIREHRNLAFLGQRKHLTWIRDRNRDFIDDRIQALYRPGQIVNVIVDLNTCLSPPEIRDLLSRFGKITYIGKFITFVVLDKVRVNKLRKLAAKPQVAMIELQVPMQPMTEVSARAIQSRRSATFSPNTAQDRDSTGAGENIAIVDTGVNDAHEAFKFDDGTPKFVTGFDATTWIDGTPMIPSNPVDTWFGGLGHGTGVAGVALGRAIPAPVDPEMDCRHPTDGTGGNQCGGGVATGAGLVDVKVCGDFLCSARDIRVGLDWLGMNARTSNIRVANISVAPNINLPCTDEDGTDDLAQQVNYLVALGISVAVMNGNARGNCGVNPGTPLITFAGAASFAMTVQGINDRGTIPRNDDGIFSDYLIGPRFDFPNLLALKPDVSAPAELIWSSAGDDLDQDGVLNDYFPATGTSLAAPHVAGAAAVLIEALKQAGRNIDPGSLKDLFKRTADSSLNGIPYDATVDPVWVPDFGSGIINVFQALNQALNAATTTDVGFPNCVGPPATLGGLCQVTAPHEIWDNSFDITTLAPPQKDVPNTITAQVRNSGPVAATVLVNFGVYILAVGNNQVFHIGTVKVTIPAMTTMTVSHPWIPTSDDHQCIQVSIQYGLDSNFDNNVTQRNLEVSPSIYEVRIENPFMVPARMEIRPKSNREGWLCKVSEESFVLDPFEDCPRKLRVAFDAPPGTPPGERANCDIAVYATPKGSEKPILIGGVTAQTFVPRPCRILGQVVDEKNSPVPQARLVFSRAEEQSVTAVTDEDGIFSVNIPPSLRYMVLVEKPSMGKGQVEQRPDCGVGKHKYVLSSKGVKVVDN